MSTLTPTLTLGTRTSNLALWQTNHIAALLQKAWPGLACQLVPYQTQGDKHLDKHLPEIGGKGVFTQALAQGLQMGQIRAAVHSLKDLPVADSPGLVVGAIVGREDPRDVLITATGQPLASLPAGAVVGSSSLRRQAQLRRLRPDLIVKPIRGNVETRLEQVRGGGYDGTLLAGAGLIRLGLTAWVAEWLPLAQMLPAPGQGALAVQCRADDGEMLRLLAAIHQPEVAAVVTAERAFLQGLGGGCAVPVGAYGVWQDGTIFLQGGVWGLDGNTAVSLSGSGHDPHQLGQTMAQQALAHGAADILRRI
jgi:hydroxymethylbilane synthase